MLRKGDSKSRFMEKKKTLVDTGTSPLSEIEALGNELGIPDCCVHLIK